MENNKSSFSGSLGFVLASAGSAVGVGNIWRFPYLAAKDGGGLFIFIYLILVLTFGFTLLATDVAIGRKTRENALNAFCSLNRKWKFLGYLTFMVPVLIMTYYSVIGGWVTKYAVTYITSNTSVAAQDGFFTSFITSKASPIFFMVFFMAITAFIVYNGVEKGIERVSKFIMVGLIFMIVSISFYSLTLNHTDASGATRTGLQGLSVYLVPDFTGLNFERFLQILLDAMSQIFFSLSVSMGIMITYGSYVKEDVDLGRSIGQIEFFDTVVALLAGLMIIPAVFVFSGRDAMSSGPSLMFISLPKVFESMGGAGRIIGLVFFIMVAFAALTSCISIMETLVANCMEIFNQSRKKMSLIIAVVFSIAAAVICLGYNVFYFTIRLPNGSEGQLLDIMDYISNSFLMPFISLLTCILIGWVIKPSWIVDEMESSGHIFKRKHLYTFMIKYVTPVMMSVLFLKSTGII